MTFGSLFSGVGGLDLGLERAGWECRFQVEIDPFCRKILDKHWPAVKKYGDIREVRGDELEPVDLIAGGFPCQDLSQAGKRAGIEGARSGLWFEFARLVGELRPRYVLVENVPGLLVYDGLRRVIGELARLGYVGCWRSLRASEFGAAHLRKRVFIVAWNGDGRREMAQSRCEHGERRNSAYDGGNIQRDVPREPDEGSGGAVPLAYRESGGRGELRQSPRRDGLADGRGEDVAHTEYEGRGIGGEAHDGDGRDALRHHADGRDPHVADAAHQLHDGAGNGFVPQPRRRPEGRDGVGSAGAELPVFAPGPADPRWPEILAARPDLAPALESGFCGVASRFSDPLELAMSHRTKRLSRLGNSVVPQAAEWVGRRILEHHNA